MEDPRPTRAITPMGVHRMGKSNWTLTLSSSLAKMELNSRSSVQLFKVKGCICPLGVAVEEFESMSNLSTPVIAVVRAESTSS